MGILPWLPGNFRSDSRLLHASSTVNSQNFAVDPGTILRREEAHDTSNVDREAHSVGW